MTENMMPANDDGIVMMQFNVDYSFQIMVMEEIRNSNTHKSTSTMAVEERVSLATVVAAAKKKKGKKNKTTKRRRQQS